MEEPVLRRAAAVALVALSALACGGAAASNEEPLTLPPGYALVWADEFDGEGAPDAARWTADTAANRTGWHNNELQYYAAENARIGGGVLRIEARRETPRHRPDWGGQDYTSARLISRGKGEWTYGFFEIRARLPCGKGTWPAIWLLGRDGEWPDAGELDIMEQVGAAPTRIFSTVHTASGSGGDGAGGATHLADACTAFHVYQMDWTGERVRFGVDGRTHFTYRNLGRGAVQWPFDAPQFLILNLAVGGDLGGPVDAAALPALMEIDYVRVYQRAVPPR